jgi:membrane fusion protein (multidrug efflux system)
MRAVGTMAIAVLATALGLAWAGPLRGGAASAALEVTAFTAPAEELDIASEIAGVIALVHVEEGREVQKGQPLVELKADLLKSQLAVSKERVTASDVEIAAARKVLETRVKEFERADALLAQKVVSPEERDKAKLEMELAKLAVDRAEAQKKVFVLAAARDEEALRQTVIRAPRAGVVFRLLKHPGEAAQENAPVLKMVVLDPLYVIAYVPLSATGQLKSGAKAALRVETHPDVALPCTVSVVDSVADAGSGLYRVRLTMPNPDRQCIAGSKGTVRFVADQ